MFDEPEQEPNERGTNPAQRAAEKTEELRMYSEIAAIFEGTRKFEAQILPGLDADIARDLQRGMAKLEKAKQPDTPILPDNMAEVATAVLNLFVEKELSPNDYHIHRRPGEVMMVRWLTGDGVDSFYDRLQAHFDAALEGLQEDERQANEWKQDNESKTYLEELGKVELSMADRYLRRFIKQHNLFVLSTQVADEFNIAYLCETVMGAPIAEVVGSASAPPDEPTEQDLAWFYKMFSLRGMKDGAEQMCFFTFLQKSDDSF